MSNISFKQFRRTYPGGTAVNFATALSGRNDFSVKTYTNFYLTEKFLLSDIVNIDTSTLKAQEIATSIRRGKADGSNDYMVFTYASVDSIKENYGLAKFFNTSSPSFSALSAFAALSTFNLQIMDNNMCRLYTIVDNRRFFLCLDNRNEVFFVKDTFLPFDSNAINPQDFTYLFSTDVNRLLLFKDTLSGYFFIKQTATRPLSSDFIAHQVIPNNNSTYFDNSLEISRDLYYIPVEDFDFNFITYTEDNKIDFSKSKFNLKNNFLLHKQYSDDDAPTDITVLKNQVHQNEVFSSSNNLLSSISDFNLYVEDLREYNAICGDIKEEISSELELNYVFYNKIYEIKPGKTEFRAPSSMYPFVKLGINDSKFVDSGAFSFVTPEFADKVYRLSNQKQNLDAGQYLLCTWLSGSVYGDKIWMDRYFYPDLINKQEAIVLSPFLEPTYEDIIEQLVQANVSLSSTLLKTPIFDKISDMVFEPNQTYVYERLKIDGSPLSSITQVTKCDVITTNLPINYFKEANKAGAFTMYMTFDGDDKEWIVFSNTNTIHAGVTITKSKTSIRIKYSLFDPSTYNVANDIDISYTIVETSDLSFKPLKVNYLSIGFNSITGEVYFTLNNEVVPITISKIDLVTNLPTDAVIAPYQFANTAILYGDFFINVKDALGNDTNLLVFDGYVRDFQIFNEFLDPNLAFIVPILNGDIDIDIIYITLPCGQRNSIDNIDLLQHICASSSFKSNNINIFLKNLNIDDEDVIQSIKNTITSNIDSQIPANTTLREIKTENYL